MGTYFILACKFYAMKCAYIPEINNNLDLGFHIMIVLLFQYLEYITPQYRNFIIILLNLSLLHRYHAFCNYY